MSGYQSEAITSLYNVVNNTKSALVVGGITIPPASGINVALTTDQVLQVLALNKAITLTKVGTSSNTVSSSAASFQVKIVTTGVAVQLPNYSLINGVILLANSTNSGPIYVGNSSAVTNVGNGNGNGFPLVAAGGNLQLSITNTNLLWINGTAGDWISVSGS